MKSLMLCLALMFSGSSSDWTDLGGGVLSPWPAWQNCPSIVDRFALNDINVNDTFVGVTLRNIKTKTTSTPYSADIWLSLGPGQLVPFNWPLTLPDNSVVLTQGAFFIANNPAFTFPFFSHFGGPCPGIFGPTDVCSPLTAVNITVPPAAVGLTLTFQMVIRDATGPGILEISRAGQTQVLP